MGVLQTLRKQRDPTGIGIDVIRGGQRIAENENRTFSGACKRRGENQ
jgi:hypothetical protein